MAGFLPRHAVCDADMSHRDARGHLSWSAGKKPGGGHRLESHG